MIKSCINFSGGIFLCSVFCVELNAFVALACFPSTGTAIFVHLKLLSSGFFCFEIINQKEKQSVCLLLDFDSCTARISLALKLLC